MAARKPGTDVFEKLGAFYMGRLRDAEGERTDELLLYDAKDLTTHAVCVGMTGSGKTGLCVGLLEEAAIDGIPSIIIDPKGDLGNLLLNFPKLRPEDFLPWIDEGEASRKGRTVAEHAQKTAELWKNGIGDWGQKPARIKKLRDAADFTIYTPGSSAGIPLSLLRSFSAPPEELMADDDLFRDRISTAVSGLLALLGIDADPIQSREHILLSNLFEGRWREGEDLDLAGLILAVQAPPFERIGVLDIDTFFPSKDRASLALKLNNLLASPGFASWMEGEPLDIQRLLWTEEGKPRVSILSIAHLSETERMFFVTLLLNEVLGWVRTQSGTSSLRALLYMDEIFGYFPPSENPPSKKPMLTLLKQARAYGLGVVLATQNPVDLDYKGLSNTGTWFLGRLQTERDKMRVLEGLEGASTSSGAAFDRQKMERTLAGLSSRVFVMNNVHDDEPVLFDTRWVLSYLRGPLTRTQIQTLMAARKKVAEKEAAAVGPEALRKASRTKKAPKLAHTRPVVPPEIPQGFVPAVADVPEGGRLVYRPALLATADLHYVSARAGVDSWETVSYLSPLGSGKVASVWGNSERLEDGPPDTDPEWDGEGEFARLPSAALKKSSFTSWERAFKTHAYRDNALTLWKSTPHKLTSSAGESESDFRVRVREAERERRDIAVEKLRKKYTPKLAALQEKIRKAEHRLEKEKSQYGQQKLQTAISMGATVLGALFGRKLGSLGTVGRATTTMRGAGRAAREKGDVARAEENIKAASKKLGELEAQFRSEAEALEEPVAADAFELSEVPVRPRKGDIAVSRMDLIWIPWIVDRRGTAQRADV